MVIRVTLTRVDNIGTPHMAIGRVDQVAAQLLLDGGCVVDGRAIWDCHHLPHDSPGNPLVTPAETANRSTSRAVEDLLSIFKDKVVALAPCQSKEVTGKVPMQHG
jgi:hypothetical protein